MLRQHSKYANFLFGNEFFNKKKQMRACDQAIGHRFERSARNHARSACILRDLRGSCFPRLYAAASLKPLAAAYHDQSVYRFPRLYAAASLKRASPWCAHAEW